MELVENKEVKLPDAGSAPIYIYISNRYILVLSRGLEVL